jgi:hypothetical protein
MNATAIKITQANFSGYTAPKVPIMAQFVNDNYPEWIMTFEAKSKFHVGRTSPTGVRSGEGNTSKGYEVTFTKNGKFKDSFDTSYTYTNKDIAYFIKMEIMS